MIQETMWKWMGFEMVPQMKLMWKQVWQSALRQAETQMQVLVPRVIQKTK